MSPLPVISNRCPFARPALPGVSAHMGTPDFRPSPPASSPVRLVHGRAAPSTPTVGSPWLPRNRNVRLDATSDPGTSPGTCHSCTRNCCLQGAGPLRPTPTMPFSGLTSSGSASPVTFAPRLLLYLRINQRITPLTARLNTRPVANGYLGGIHTHSITQPCQVASPHGALQKVIHSTARDWSLR
jgi:hypothetical protein